MTMDGDSPAATNQSQTGRAMKPDLIEAIAASNADEAERAREAAAKPSQFDLWSDSVIQLDMLGQIVDVGVVVVNGVRMVGSGIVAVCDAIPTLD